MNKVYVFILLFVSSLTAVCEENGESEAIFEGKYALSYSYVPHYKLIDDRNDPNHFPLDEKSLYGSGYKLSLHIPLSSQGQMQHDAAPISINYSKYKFDKNSEFQDPSIESLSFGSYLVGPYYRSDAFDLTIGYLPEIGIVKYKYEIGDSGRWFLFGEVGMDLGVTLVKSVRLSTGFTYHLIGLPGETVGYGHYYYGKITAMF